MKKLLQKIIIVGTLFFFTSMGHSLFAQSFTLLKDLCPNNNSGFPMNFIEINGTLYFSGSRDSAIQGKKGFQLWKSDGTEANTVSLKIFQTTTNSAEMKFFTNVGGTLFFIFRPNTNSALDELWKSDGTAEGTVKVKALKAKAENLHALDNSKLVFVANPNYNISSDQSEVWISDGTESGTHLIKDIYPGGKDFENGMTIFKGKAYFLANETAKDEYNYCTDGTETGTARTTFGAGKVFDGYMYYSRSEGVNNVIYKTDGTTETLVYTGASFGNAVKFNNEIYFSNVFALWKTDGTPEGTKLADASAGYLINGASSDFLISFGTGYPGQCYLTNASGTSKFSPKAGFPMPLGGTGYSAGKVLFSQTGTNLYYTDGTDGGTVGISKAIYASIIYKNKLYVNIDNGEGKSFELYTSDIPGGGSSPTNENDIQNNSEFGFFPNPVQNLITIDLKEGGNANVEILDQNGQVLISTQLSENANEIDLKALSSGLHLIRLTNEKGFFVNQFIKQ